MPCAWASSTSAPTPATCSWSMRTVVRPRCRRSRTSSRCAWPSTSTTHGAVTQEGHRCAHRLLRLRRPRRRGQGLRGHARLRDLRGARLGQLRRGARARQPSTAGVNLAVLSGEDEARLTFLAVRRWFGWSAGRLAVFDIGGGSLEIAGGTDEAPDVAWSLPLGAARLARTWFGGDRPPTTRRCADLRRQIRADIARDAGHLLRPGVPDRAAATSKTFRSLARICGAAPERRRAARAARPRARRPCPSGSPS